MAKLFSRAKVNTATAGTGTITLGAAYSNAFCTFAEAGVANSDVVAYVIEDGSDFEIGIGTYTSAGTTLSRDTVRLSKIGGTAGTTKLTLSGSAVVFLSPAKEDLDTFVVGPASATDNAAVRFDATTGKLVQTSALLIADTTGAISRSGNGGIQQQGTNTNDNAAAGEVGEFVNASVAKASAVSLTTNTAANVTSISLTAGDWDVYGLVAYSPGATTTCTFALGVISSTTLDLNQVATGSGTLRVDGWGNQNATVAGFPPDPSPLPPTRFSLSATTTIYLVSYSTFAISTMGAWGYISARRVR